MYSVCVGGHRGHEYQINQLLITKTKKTKYIKIHIYILYINIQTTNK